MVAGDKIHDVVDEQIEKAKAVIVLWSPFSVKSDWVRGEAQTAHELAKLVPIKIAECKVPINYRGIHTPAVYKSKSELDEFARMLSDKYRTAQASGVTLGPNGATEIKFNVNSSDDFLTQLAAQRLAYKKEYSEFSTDWSPEAWKRTFRLIKKYPVGATWIIVSAIIWFPVFGALILLDPAIKKTFGVSVRDVWHVIFQLWFGALVVSLLFALGSDVVSWIFGNCEEPTKKIAPCPGCGTNLSLPGESSGHFKCPSCGQVFEAKT